jgi:hypothetical protein
MGDTPPTGTAIPRPKRFAAVAQPSEVPASSGTHVPEDPGFRVPERNPTLKEIYALIDQRLTPEIIERISSVPPSQPQRPSLAVRAAKSSPRILSYVISAIVVLGQAIASAYLPEYRGPIIQAGKLILIAVAEAMKEDPTAPPEPAVAAGGAGGSTQ